MKPIEPGGWAHDSTGAVSVKEERVEEWVREVIADIRANSVPGDHALRASGNRFVIAFRHEDEITYNVLQPVRSGGVPLVPEKP